jgi:hypothetical protein
MSYTTFESGHAEAALRGTEQHYSGWFVRHLTDGLLDPLNRADELMARIENAPDYLRATYQSGAGWGIRFADSFRLASHVDTMAFRVGDRRVTAFELQLNTAILVGNDAGRLLAFLAAQADIHGWVAEHNRGWLADIIDEGRESGILRPEQGWEQVAALLRNGDGGPVVTSYSVTSSFPSRSEIGWAPPAGEKWSDDALAEAWSELPAAERWAIGVTALDPGAEWSPERWHRPMFGGGLTAFDVTAPLSDDEAARVPTSSSPSRA